MTKSISPRFAFFLLYVPFVANDFGFIALSGTYAVYILDYTCRLLVIYGYLFWSATRKKLPPKILQPIRPELAVLAIVGLPIAGLLISRVIGLPQDSWASWSVWFRYPHISDPALYWMDLTFGLILVAISEELVFRKLAFEWLSTKGRKGSFIPLISSAFFAVAHWSTGLGSMVSVFLTGMLYMAVYMKLRRIWPLVCAHWIHNFFIYGPF